MKLQERDKRALMLLAVVTTLVIGWWATSEDDAPAPVVAAVDNIPSAEKRLARLRQLAGIGARQAGTARSGFGGVAGAGERLDSGGHGRAGAGAVAADPSQTREKPDARRSICAIARSGQVKTVRRQIWGSDSRAELRVAYRSTHQLLSDLTAQKEIIGVNDMRIGGANPKEKTVPVRLTYFRPGAP